MRGRLGRPFFRFRDRPLDTISSTQNKRIRYVKALRSKARLRRGEGKLVLEGARLIADALQHGGAPDLALYVPEGADYHLIARLQNKRCTLLPVSRDVLLFASDTQQPPGILGVFHIPKPRIPQPTERVLILDGISEPGNLGTILRSAAAAGIELAILAPGCVDPYNAKALRAGMGAHFRLALVEASWKEIRGFCSDMAVYAATAEAEAQYNEVDWRGACCLIVGNEAHGIGRQARALARTLIAIPMAGAAESLNVASAAAVILFEARRQVLAAAAAPGKAGAA